MNDPPGDGTEQTPDEVVESTPIAANDHTSVATSSDGRVGESAPTPLESSSSIVDVVPLSSQPSVRPAKRSLWSTRVSLLLVAALVGGLAGHYASSTNSGPGGVTIDAVTNKPGAGYLPGGVSIPKLIDKALPSIVSIDVKAQGGEDQGTGMVITSSGLVITNNHVIAAAVNGGTITVTRTGSTKALPATLIGTNPVDDVALIRINNISGLTRSEERRVGKECR